MTPGEMGKIFQFLLKFREVSAKPYMRSRRIKEGEEEIGQLLDETYMSDPEGYAMFEEFLRPQGFTLIKFAQSDFGRDGDENIYVMARRDDNAALYMDKDWLIKSMSDGRMTDDKADRSTKVIWTIFMWIELQQLLYCRLVPPRGVDEITRYRDAVVTEQEFADHLSACIDELRKEGRPDKESPIAYATLCSGGISVTTMVKKFLTAMVNSMMLEEIQSADSRAFRQTLLAAVSLRFAVEKGLHYLNPSLDDGNTKVTVKEMVDGGLN